MGHSKWPTLHSSRIRRDESPHSTPIRHASSRAQSKGNMTHLSNMRHSSETSTDGVTVNWRVACECRTLRQKKLRDTERGWVVEQAVEGQSQPAGGRRVLNTQCQLWLSEILHPTDSAECVLGCIVGFSESLTGKPTRRKVYNDLQSNKMSKDLQMCCRTEDIKCVGDPSYMERPS